MSQIGRWHLFRLPSAICHPPSAIRTAANPMSMSHLSLSLAARETCKTCETAKAKCQAQLLYRQPPFYPPPLIQTPTLVTVRNMRSPSPWLT